MYTLSQKDSGNHLPPMDSRDRALRKDFGAFYFIKDTFRDKATSLKHKTRSMCITEAVNLPFRALDIVFFIRKIFGIWHFCFLWTDDSSYCSFPSTEQTFPTILRASPCFVIIWIADHHLRGISCVNTSLCKEEVAAEKTRHK